MHIYIYIGSLLRSMRLSILKSQIQKPCMHADTLHCIALMAASSAFFSAPPQNIYPPRGNLHFDPSSSSSSKITFSSFLGGGSTHSHRFFNLLRPLISPPLRYSQSPTVVPITNVVANKQNNLKSKTTTSPSNLQVLYLIIIQFS